MANTGKTFQLKILYGEGNEQVLSFQASSIQKAGHTVEKATSRQAVQQALRKGTFDLVILGPTLSRDDRHHLPYIVKKANQGTRVLVLHADGGRHPYVDGNLDTGHDLQELLGKIASMQQELVTS
jgi:DNA-binding response OmpR family regulator